MSRGLFEQVTDGRCAAPLARPTQGRTLRSSVDFTTAMPPRSSTPKSKKYETPVGGEDAKGGISQDEVRAWTPEDVVGSRGRRCRGLELTVSPSVACWGDGDHFVLFIAHPRSQAKARRTRRSSLRTSRAACSAASVAHATRSSPTRSRRDSLTAQKEGDVPVAPRLRRLFPPFGR